ncbi:MAG: hypothetical protein JXA64_09025 [Candidatus Fermentibacteraceae bacterium]|nr:hypothetical protein [Candidatus Fermentibacteraceae bacterium]MBN2609245.1 hypothetical protein [Candidatus Fermentibacteraceae bacterium]
MKKLGLLVLVVGIVLMAGCAGDDPAGPSGTLEDVTGLAIGSASAGRDVVLTWNAVSVTVDGYAVFFRATETADWTEIQQVTGTTYTHTADNSGYYTVKAYEGTNYSTNNSNIVNTMPNQIMATYTIWDNHAPTDSTSGFVFGATAGQRVLAASSTNHDIYCYDGNWTQSPCGFYSGDKAPFGGGHETFMKLAEGSIYSYPPSSGWWDSNYVLAGDVIFAELYNGYYVKIYVQAIPQCPAQPLSYGVTFYFDYQPIQGLYLFTTESS